MKTMSLILSLFALLMVQVGCESKRGEPIERQEEPISGPFGVPARGSGSEAN